ncbi:thioredoxin family protein, partial [Candidatus Babeliales bacterium]|nr:thioredoxin family protein [Candidatus Babeliales bacterium]
TFVEIDTDSFTDAQKLNIKGIPAFIGYKHGKEKLRFTGARSYEELKDEIKELT